MVQVEVQLQGIESTSRMNLALRIEDGPRLAVLKWILQHRRLKGEQVTTRRNQLLNVVERLELFVQAIKLGQVIGRHCMNRWRNAIMLSTLLNRPLSSLAW
jgi:hypothetical protein